MAEMKRIFVGLLILFFITGCGNPADISEQASSVEEPVESAVTDTASPSETMAFKFPLPEDADAIDENESRNIAFQTNLTIREVADFYRQELSALGLVETGSQIVDTTDHRIAWDWGGRLFFNDPASGLDIWVSITPASAMFIPIEKVTFVYLTVLDDSIALVPLTSNVLDYPLPEDAQMIDLKNLKNITQFATDLSLDEVAAFYRREFSALGLVEMNDTLTESSTGMIFFGYPAHGIEITVGLAPGSASPTPIEKATLVSLLSLGPPPPPMASFLSEHPEYPMTPDAAVLDDNIDYIDFETDLSINEVVEFYRGELTALGLVETRFSIDEKMTGSLWFDAPGQGTIILVTFAPADEAPFRFRNMEKSTFVGLAFYPALIDPCESYHSTCSDNP